MATRRTRREEWGKMRDAMAGHVTQKKGMEGRETIPEVACGKCRNFLDNAYVSDGKGFCGKLKFGSDLTQIPPIYFLEGDNAMMTYFAADASKCKYYEKMEFIDTDGTECADPKYQRIQRQLTKKD